MLIFEFIPDIEHLWKYNGVKSNSYDGKVLIYNKNYKLKRGYVYQKGKVIGKISTINVSNKSKVQSTPKVAVSATNCTQNVQVFINVSGTYEVILIEICDTIYITDFWISGSGYIEPLITGGYGGLTRGTGIIPIGNIPLPVFPGIELPRINDIRKYTNCFSGQSSNSLNLKLTIYVQEPYPSYGSLIFPSSSGGYGVGHAFIGISNGDITQVIGFYPSGKMLGAAGLSTGFGNNIYSEIHDNSGTEYTISTSYNLIPSDFNNMIDFINGFNPNSYTYNLFNHNCTNFVFDAASAAGINLPYSGPGDFFDKSHAQLGQDLRNSGHANNTPDIAPSSNGPCN